MKINWNYIKAFLVLALVVFLFGFAEKRNNNRKINNVAINFVDDENLYVTQEIVNKLLIQNNEKVKNASKEAIALKDVENRIDNHDMIADSDVYLTVNGTLGVTVKQRKPIARVSHQKAFYIDEEGKTMPLSKFHSARVPLVYHISEKDIDVLFPLLKYITKDVFLTKHVTAIQKTSKGTYNLQLRDVDFEVDFGHIEDIDRKVNNLKAFYQKALKDKKIEPV